MARDQPAERAVRAPVARGRADACHQRAIAYAEDSSWRAPAWTRTANVASSMTTMIALAQAKL
jgi:hypothetical protein